MEGVGALVPFPSKSDIGFRSFKENRELFSEKRIVCSLAEKVILDFLVRYLFWTI